ncbi:MAG: polysaccharide pyruvyl transferase family protein [Photobacterium frigidiphilum]|uniref:polysaccharide pyruvyl transferase family protein n=1 Tax=Photobacterium frigidiphilum TaxID=264736 RepID=UPI003002B0AF
MKKVTLYSPGLASYNLGDKIISESAKKELDYIIKHAFVTELPTHTAHSWYYCRPLINNEYKFVLGSNLLKSTFFGFKRQWDVTLLKAWITGPCVLVGVGWWQYGNKPNLYTKLLLKSILSKKYIHSVRDSYTEEVLKSIGINNVINTSCATMWSLTKEHCRNISKVKADKVIFTLTDYNRDEKNDIKLINKLMSNYDEVYFWPQGIDDFEYINGLMNVDAINIISPSLPSFDELLSKGNIDYIGTRLHGGIRALQYSLRTMIIAIDNRAIEKNKNFNLPIVKRDELDKLDDFIKLPYEISITIPEADIALWKAQFE